MEFEGQIYDIDLQADDQSAIRRRAISKRHHNAEDPEYDLGSDDGSEEMLGDDTNAVGYPNSLKVTHKYGRVPEAFRCRLSYNSDACDTFFHLCSGVSS